MASRNIPLFQDWYLILSDIQDFLKAEAVVDINQSTAASSLDEMFRIVLPALCRRVCELASRLGATVGDTSASVMICHTNDVKNGILALRVFESFPNYGLDRTIATREGKWNLHLRYVHYKDIHNPSLNRDVVADAILKHVDVNRRVENNTSTPSEKTSHIVAVNSIIPLQLATANNIEQIKPGTVVALNIDFYESETTGYASVLETVERLNILKKILSDIYEISLFQTLTHEERAKGIKEFFDSIDKKQIINITLQGLVKLFFSALPS